MTLQNQVLGLLGLPIVLLTIYIIIKLIKEYHLIRLQKRFEPFALISIKEKEESITDSLVKRTWKLSHKISKILKKSILLSKYSTYYEKYVPFEEREKKSGMDYITLKIILSILLILLGLTSQAMKESTIQFFPIFLSLIIGFFLPDLFLKAEYFTKRKKIEEDLLKAIILMNNSFQSGRTIMQAVEIAKEELEGPISDEFKKIHMDMTYGLSVDVVFNRFYERVKLEDAKYITSSLTLLNKTGGNIIQVFKSIEKSIFDKKKLEQEMKSLTTASVFMYRTLSILPILFAIIILLLNPHYFDPFFKTPFGFLTFLLTTILYISYILIIKKALKVKME